MSRRAGLLSAASVICMVMGTVLLGAGAGAAPSTKSTAGSVTVTKTVTRDQVQGGQNVVVDSKTVTLHVSQTTGLQGRQEIAVSWSGAHPTGAIVSDQNSSQAEYEEYPFVLLECRGIDSTTATPTQRLTPETCWTQASTERYQSSRGDAYPPYRLDEYAANPGAAEVGEPSPLLLPSGPTRGPWSATTTYKKNDWVTSGGKTTARSRQSQRTRLTRRRRQTRHFGSSSHQYEPRAPWREMLPSSTGSPGTPPTARSTTVDRLAVPGSRRRRTTWRARRSRATRRSA